jgi:cell division protein FtsI (penicillin-binding protein 3)
MKSVLGPVTRGRAALILGCAASVFSALACAGTTADKRVTTAPPRAIVLPPLAAGSTINPKMQTIADDEIDRLVSDWQPAAATILVLDPSTGEVLADAGRTDGAYADVAVRREYITGSTMKAFTLAAALEDGVLSPSERIDCEQGAWVYQGKILRDASPNGVLTVPQMLAVSSNIGFSKVFERLGGARLDHWLRTFHFGTAPGIEGASGGKMPARIVDKSYAGAMAAIGELITASPLQVAAGYAAIANHGLYVEPTSSRHARPPRREQILKPETARTVVGMLEEAVNGPEATGKLAQVSGQRVAGKTGTAGWERPTGGEGVYASFVGFVPSTAPRFVILVGAEQPRDGRENENGNGGGQVAAPVFARVASRLLAR